MRDSDLLLHFHFTRSPFAFHYMLQQIRRRPVTANYIPFIKKRDKLFVQVLIVFYQLPKQSEISAQSTDTCWFS